MKKIDNEEMKNIEGGTQFSASMLSGIYRTIEVIMNIGEALGSYIRRKIEGKMCDI